MLEIMEVIMETYKAEKNWILNYLILASIPAFYFLQKKKSKKYDVEWG